MAGIDEILNEELGILQADVIKRHNQAGQRATGKTTAAYTHYMTGAQSGELAGPAYAEALERGRGKATGKSSGKGAFKENLKEWILARGLSYKDEKDLEQLARFLAWWINKNGTKLFGSGRTVDLLTTPINDFTERLTTRLSSFYISEIENEILKK